MNQGKLDVVEQELARVNIDIFGISKLKWMRMGEFNSDDNYIYYCGQESYRRNGVALIIHKRVQNATPGCNPKNDRMISVCFQGKPFNITVIQAYCNYWGSWSVLWKPKRPPRTKTKKRCPIHHKGLECKSMSKDTWSNRQVWSWSTKWSRAKANRILPRERTGHSKTPFLNNTRDDFTHGYHRMVNTEIRLITVFAVKEGEVVYSQQKQELELTVAQIISFS